MIYLSQGARIAHQSPLVVRWTVACLLATAVAMVHPSAGSSSVNSNEARGASASAARASGSPVEVAQQPSYVPVTGGSGPYVFVDSVEVSATGFAEFDTDTADADLLIIDWGDGSSTTMITSPATSDTYSHQYAPGTYLATFTVYNSNGMSYESGGSVYYPAAEISCLTAFYDSIESKCYISGGSIDYTTGASVEISWGTTTITTSVDSSGDFSHGTTNDLTGLQISARIAQTGGTWSDWYYE